MRSYSQKADTVTMHSDLIQVIVIIWEILMCWLHTTSGQRIKALARLSITCGTTQSCSNATTEFYTCQKFGSEIDQRLEIKYIFTHNHCVFLYVNVEHGWRGWERWSLKAKSLWFDPGRRHDLNFLHICWMLEVMRFETWLNFQNACAIIV